MGGQKIDQTIDVSDGHKINSLLSPKMSVKPQQKIRTGRKGSLALASPIGGHVEENNQRRMTNNSILAAQVQSEKDNCSPITKLSYSPSPRLKSNLSPKEANESSSEMYSNSGFESTLQTPFNIGPFEKDQKRQSLRNNELVEQRREPASPEQVKKTPIFGGGKIKKSLLALNLDSRLEKKN